MKIILNVLTSVLLLTVLYSHNAYSQTEGFNVKTPIQKIADSTTKFLKTIIDESAKESEKSIPSNLVCSSSCFVVIPDIEVIESRGDFTGTGLMSCRATNSDTFTEPLFYKINNLKSFDEGGGGVIILATDKTGMKSLLGNEVHVNSENLIPGPIGSSSEADMKTFAAYVKYKDQKLSGTDLSGSILEYSSRDTFNAYQGTVVPIDVLIAPKEVPPFLREFDSLLLQWTENCK